jgi:hypothetical protein
MMAIRTNEPVTAGSRSLFGLNKNTIGQTFSGQTLITILMVLEAFLVVSWLVHGQRIHSLICFERVATVFAFGQPPATGPCSDLHCYSLCT